jgi:hypothetical protein
MRPEDPVMRIFMEEKAKSGDLRAEIRRGSRVEEEKLEA